MISQAKRERSIWPMRSGLVAGVVFSLFMIWTCATQGYSSWLIARAEKQPSLVSADRGVALNRSYPEAHLLRGAMLEANDDLRSAIAEYENAAALRPQDYVLWLSSARARELNGERDKAIAAARSAVPLAPFYAQTHWQLGNLLVRDGQIGEGLAELRTAAAINADFLPPVIDLAWQLSRGDVQLVKNTIRPTRPNDFAALGDYLKIHDRTDEATEMFAAAGSDPQMRQRRQQFVGELIAARKFAAAYRLWSIDHAPVSPNGNDVLIDGGFEQESNLDEPGFGWRGDNQATSITRVLDTSNPRQGRTSLRIDFNGDSDPNAPIVSQFVLVAPRTHYRLQFAARAEEIVSGGLPVLRVIDATTGATITEEKAIAASTEWRDYSIDFATGDSTVTIQISLLRNTCHTGPCPIFGRLWLDALTLEKSGT